MITTRKIKQYKFKRTDKEVIAIKKGDDYEELNVDELVSTEEIIESDTKEKLKVEIAKKKEAIHKEKKEIEKPVVEKKKSK